MKQPCMGKGVFWSTPADTWDSSKYFLESRFLRQLLSFFTI